MSSKRLKHVYDSSRWRGPIREMVLARAGGRCEHTERSQVFGDMVRCRQLDRSFGGRVSLLIDHVDENHPDPFDTDNLQALCPRHSGMKDGPRAHRGRRR